MSGPNPPEPGSAADAPGNGQSVPKGFQDEVGEIGESVDAGPLGDPEAYSQAYSAPESEQFVSGPYVPVDPRLYDYDSYQVPGESYAEAKTPRWPWVVGGTVIIAAIALVVSVGLLVARTETPNLAIPATTITTPSLPPVQDEIITSTPPPPPPTEEPPPPPPTETPAPEPSPAEAPSPEPTTTSPPAMTTTTTTTPARPLQITYSVTGTKAPFDQITITYIDASGQRRTQRNAYIPWSLTLTPISLSEVGSVEASSMLRLSKLNCSITNSDGTVLRSSTGDSPQASC